VIQTDFETLPKGRRPFAPLKIFGHLFSEVTRRSGSTGREPKSCNFGVIRDFGIKAGLRFQRFHPRH